MNINEIDFRYNWIASVYDALESGLSSIEKRGIEDVWFDGLWQLEHSETILGISFVCAQTYILGTVQDINNIRIDLGKPSIDKLKYYEDDIKPPLSGSSRIMLINSIANYFKHHDEWDVWPVNLTTKTLADVGITDKTDFPCYKAVTILWDEKECKNLGNLLNIVSEWREFILMKYK
jgi:hypothetical protein